MPTLPTHHVKKYIAGHLPAIHSIEDVARELGVSAQTLRKDFMRCERVSLREYIVARRVEEMREMLKKSELTCMEICVELGCREDVGARFFKRYTGMTMKQFRELCRQELNP